MKKLRSLGVTSKEDAARKERLAATIRSIEKTALTANHLVSKSFAKVFRSGLQKAGDFAKIKVEEAEVRDKIGQLNCFLVGWW